jgi:glycosyltransferase involved in cell wall biosynthesis
MLSICIPVYDSDVTDLVTSLLNQINEIDSKIEICIIDDASPNPKGDISSINHPSVYFHKNLENVGRSKIRNQFLEKTKYSYLLFLDGDSRILSSDFLKKYSSMLMKAEFEVLCGASVYQKEKPDRLHYLRWKYSIVRESKSLRERQENSNLGFKTNNFIIHRTVFERIKFNQTIIGYGHEDSLFGFELKKSNIRIEHVDNPVLNFHLDDNNTYLEKTKESVRNLKQVLTLVNFDTEFIKSSKLSRIYSWFQKYRLSRFVKSLLVFIHPINTFLLSKGYFILPMFDMYKLTLMIQKK